MKTVSTRRLLRHRLQQLLLDIRDTMPRLSEAEDAEALHQLRIALRQLRSLLQALAALPNGKPLRIVQGQLGEFTQRSNSWRDREVRLQQLETLAAQYDTRTFAAWRRREAQQLQAGRCQLQQQASELEQLLEASWQHCQPVLSNGSERLRRGLRSALQRTRRRYRTARVAWRQQAGDEQAEHRVRLLAKRLRYQVEVCADVVGKRWLRRAERAKQCQQQLGDARDRVLLLRSLREDAVPLPAALRRLLGL
ncbi:CHAD domain-containing protein [Vogesella sp. LIG4]|uniref:CHAD domain-containing protein n=1 Tax=Vogesella sp. LIG4 TaxID=1192162 RepID=UPI00081FEB80|nr:CHAD domain-containing protein [Vogesella sp. LIG4]SCK20693.1 CHAD domain-containing protein [Vogesella sp. LIG4]